jgi:histidyl-tRNA synthetase
VTQWELHLNSIGDANCRPQYVEQLTAWLDEHPELLEDEEVQHKRATSVLQVFDVKNERLRAALGDAPKIGDSLCDACRTHFDAVRRYLDRYGVPYVLDASLVRGLDYYTRTTFEFIGPEENVNSTICGGGRYDGLVKAVGGGDVPGIGFGAGLERLQLAIERESSAPEPKPLDIFVACESEEAREGVLPAIARWRSEGRSVDTDYAGRSMKGQLTQAQRKNATTIVVARADGTYEVRRRGSEDRYIDDLNDL